MPNPPSFQSGITNRPPEHVLLGAFDFVNADTEPNRQVINSLRELIHRELKSDLDDQDPTTVKDAPSPETGELGFADRYDRAHLTITVGFGKAAFDRLGVPSEQQPQDLIPIPWEKLLDTPLNPNNGDLIVQACSDDVYVCEHVIRRIEEELGSQLTLVWSQLGAQRYTTRQGRTSRREGRALIGFLDGTANLDPRDNIDERRLVFVDPGEVAGYPALPQSETPGYGGPPGTEFPGDLRPPPSGEPEWAKQGSYMVVRGSLQDIGAWDDQTLGAQENIIGRFKYSGAFLDLVDDGTHLNDPPAFEANQADVRVPVGSHVRKVNPRRPEDLDRRIFRRGYPLIVANEQKLARGLLFIAFARSISTQFEFIMRAWMKNENFPQHGDGRDRLLAFDTTVTTGGYFFVPPIRHRHQPWTWFLPYE